MEDYSNVTVDITGFFVHVVDFNEQLAHVCAVSVPGFEHGVTIALPQTDGTQVSMNLAGWDVELAGTPEATGLLTGSGFDAALRFGELYDGLTLSPAWRRAQNLVGSLELAHGTLDALVSTVEAGREWCFRQKERGQQCKVVTDHIVFTSSLARPRLLFRRRGEPRQQDPLEFVLAGPSPTVKVMSQAIGVSPERELPEEEQYALDLAHFHAVALLGQLDPLTYFNRPTVPDKPEDRSGGRPNCKGGVFIAGTPGRQQH